MAPSSRGAGGCPETGLGCLGRLGRRLGWGRGGWLMHGLGLIGLTGLGLAGLGWEWQRPALFAFCAGLAPLFLASLFPNLPRSQCCPNIPPRSLQREVRPAGAATDARAAHDAGQRQLCRRHAQEDRHAGPLQAAALEEVGPASLLAARGTALPRSACSKPSACARPPRQPSCRHLHRRPLGAG
jgi:hypothetical protein